MKRNTITLGNLGEEVENNAEVELTKDSTIKAGAINIIKRDGRKEPYNPKKMRRVCLWATDNNEFLAEELIESTEIKLYEEIKIVDVYEEIIKTAVNKISLLYPQWEYIAAKLFLLKIYKETWNISDGNYPPYDQVLSKGIQHGIYNREVVESYSTEELEIFGNAINTENDLLFTYKGLLTFHDKYCLNYSKTKKLELPQHVYMRVAMFNHHKDHHSERVNNVLETYERLSTHEYTNGTPITLNSLTKNPQMSSCVLNAMNDDSVSILDTIKNLGIYSKFKGGTAVDISRLRAKGSYIHGNQGYSSGAVPFVKVIESTMKAWNQGSKRPGACAVYYQWWHIDFHDLIVLKSNGGTDSNRARGLKYAVKINQILIDRWIRNEDITLFDPKDVDGLFNKWGDAFVKAYEEYEAKSHIRKKVVNSRELLLALMKERTETGNIYLFHEENVNDANMTGTYVNSSNLCMEILEASRPSILKNEELVIKETGKRVIQKEYDAGEIALCNLSSINLMKYYYMSDEDKDKLVFSVVQFMDNTVDISRYPVKEGMSSNMMWRYLGIGVSNYANLIASEKMKMDSQEALEFAAELFDDLSYRLYNASCELAVKKGSFPNFHKTEWARGLTPVHKANEKALNITDFKPDMDKWNELGEKIKRHGMRNALVMAIAPTATSGKAIAATESINPVVNYLYKDEGTTNIRSLVPNFRQNNAYYTKAFDMDQMWLVKHAAVRQIYLDQAQSIDLYFERPDSYKDLMKVHIAAFMYGIKTLYYVNQMKGSDNEVCESCS